MRHAESQEDVDKSVYAHTPDLDIGLSPNGELQAVNAGAKLLAMRTADYLHFYLSPGVRLRQTYNLITTQFPADVKHSSTVKTLLLKQFWGDVTVDNRREIEIARYREGVLVYRFPNGESGPELIERFRLFVDELRRDFQKEDFPENIVILTHGFEMRVFLMVWFDWSTQYFESLANPRNCEIAVMTLQANGAYCLEHILRTYDPTSNPSHISRI